MLILGRHCAWYWGLGIWNLGYRQVDRQKELIARTPKSAWGWRSTGAICGSSHSLPLLFRLPWATFKSLNMPSYFSVLISLMLFFCPSAPRKLLCCLIISMANGPAIVCYFVYLSLRVPSKQGLSFAVLFSLPF